MAKHRPHRVHDEPLVADADREVGAGLQVNREDARYTSACSPRPHVYSVQDASSRAEVDDHNFVILVAN